MRQRESAYWDSVANSREGLNDNIWKRCAIVSRLLSHIPVGARILEIGVGQGLAAAVTNLITIGNIEYTGTDVSANFADFVAKRWKLNTVQTDILALPDGPFEMIWCFDSLEHVHPDDREAGYAEIARVFGEHGVILINAPMSETQHDLEFDHPFNEADILAINAACGTTITKYEPYHLEQVGRNYLWVEMTR